MNWTRRMSEVDGIDLAWLAAGHDRRPTLKAVGAALGLSSESIRRHRWKIERWKRFGHQLDAHVQLWRRLWIEALAAFPELTYREAASQRRKSRENREENWHVIAYRDALLQRQRHQHAMEFMASEAKRQRGRQRLERALRAELAAQIANDPRIRAMDQWARDCARKAGYR